MVLIYKTFRPAPVPTESPVRWVLEAVFQGCRAGHLHQ